MTDRPRPQTPQTPALGPPSALRPSTRDLLHRATREEVEIIFPRREPALKYVANLLRARASIERVHPEDPRVDVEIFYRIDPSGRPVVVLSPWSSHLSEIGVEVRLPATGEVINARQDSLARRAATQQTPPTPQTPPPTDLDLEEADPEGGPAADPT